MDYGCNNSSFNEFPDNISTEITCNGNWSGNRRPRSLGILSSVEFNITLYGIIFLLSVCGNILVILTLIREKKMRTITNLFLLNLAISDMMLSVLCMPFSLVATVVLRKFIFGEVMCILIRYFQAVSVGVSCYTLVTISLERYYAICHPLRSRRWQTLSHARRMIMGIWVLTLLTMSPIAAFHRLVPLRSGDQACREIWPPLLIQYRIDLAYSVVLVIVLLLFPLLFMTAFYSMVAKKLYISSQSCSAADMALLPRTSHYSNGSNGNKNSVSTVEVTRNLRDPSNRKRVIRMLVVIVLQYFICWTPIYLLNTWQAFDFRSVLRYISPTVKSLVLLLAYTSSFVHPITYCFMNKGFRRGFARSFSCSSRNQSKTLYSVTNFNSTTNGTQN